MKNKSKVFVVAVIALCACQVAVVLLSWVAAVLLPARGINSLLSSAGFRWLLSSYEENVNTSLFFYFLVVCFAVGTVVAAGIPRKIASLSAATYHERLGVGVLLSGVIVAVLLSVVAAVYPHSFMLSITGTLVPGPYLKGVLMLFAIVLAAGSSIYVALSGEGDPSKRVANVLTAGLRAVVPLTIVYFLLVELVCMLLYVW